MSDKYIFFLPSRLDAGAYPKLISQDFQVITLQVVPVLFWPRRVGLTVHDHLRAVYELLCHVVPNQHGGKSCTCGNISNVCCSPKEKDALPIWIFSNVACQNMAAFEFLLYWWHVGSIDACRVIDLWRLSRRAFRRQKPQGIHALM